MYSILIGVNKNEDTFIGFRILDADSGKYVDASAVNVVAAINRGIAVDGIDISTGEVKGSNGSFDRYAQLFNGLTVGKAPVVIIRECNNKEYDVADPYGKIAHMTLVNLIKYATEEGIANGKIVTTETGKYISPINGKFRPAPDLVDTSKDGQDLMKAKLSILGVITGYKLDNGIAKSNGEQHESIKIYPGCTSIARVGFKGARKLKTVELPVTCTSLGLGAFEECKSLENINIPDGTTSIPARCFHNCKSLTEIVLPNSIRVIGDEAFGGCGKLKKISIGPIPIKIGVNAILPATKVIIRK